VSLGDDPLSTRTLRIGGVYTLLIVEEENGTTVSKDSVLLQQHYKEL
jgi:hypothetical protein